MRNALLTALLVLLALGYPLAVYFGLQYMEPRMIGFFLMAVFGLRIFISRHQLKGNIKPLLPVMLLALLCSLMAVLLNSQSLLRITPSVINFTSLVFFAVTLWRPPSMIERFARLKEPNLDTHGVLYTRKVTIVWCGFFVLNGSVALYTAFYSSLAVWTLYNGLIAYILMGVLFVGEYGVRLWVRRRIGQ